MPALPSPKRPIALLAAIALAAGGCVFEPVEPAAPGDAAAPDTIPAGSDASDSDPSDASDSSDASEVTDAGPQPPDASAPDASAPDAAGVDAGVDAAVAPDAGRADAGPPDAGAPDAGAPDASLPDASAPDAGSAPDSGPRPFSRIDWAEGSYFALGANYPWGRYPETNVGSYGVDFGSNLWGAVGVHTGRTFNDDFADMASHGVHVARWFVFSDGRAGIVFGADGTPLGIDPYVFQDLDAAIALAREHNIYLVLVLLDFGWLFEPVVSGGVVIGGHGDTFIEPAKGQALIDNVIGPVLARYGAEPYVLAWEVMNEPEWVISDLPMPSVHAQAVPVTMAQFYGLASKITEAVHTNTYSYATLGSACLKWHRVWTDAFADKKGYPRLGLDIHQTHYYSWMDDEIWDRVWAHPDLGTTTFSPRSQPAWLLGLGRPIIVGEFFTPQGQAYTLLERFEQNGYAGALPWSYNADDLIDWSTWDVWHQEHEPMVSIPSSP